MAHCLSFYKQTLKSHEVLHGPLYCSNDNCIKAITIYSNNNCIKEVIVFKVMFVKLISVNSGNVCPAWNIVCFLHI